MRNHTHQAVEWLAAAAIDPRACKRDWQTDRGTAVLGAGRFWDVLSVPEELGLFALDVLLRSEHPGPAAAPGVGPVLADFAAHRVGFFLPPDPRSRWVGDGIRYAGKGTWIAVPAPQRSSGPLRWLVPPDGSGTLCSPDAVEVAFQQAAAILAALLDPSRPGRGVRAAEAEVHRRVLRARGSADTGQPQA
ncbi:hypothetical protein [Streptomyces sp. NPDC003635]